MSNWHWVICTEDTLIQGSQGNVTLYMFVVCCLRFLVLSNHCTQGRETEGYNAFVETYLPALFPGLSHNTCPTHPELQPGRTISSSLIYVLRYHRKPPLTSQGRDRNTFLYESIVFCSDIPHDINHISLSSDYKSVSNMRSPLWNEESYELYSPWF